MNMQKIYNKTAHNNNEKKYLLEIKLRLNNKGVGGALRGFTNMIKKI